MSPQPHPQPIPRVTSLAGARQLADGMMQTMDALLAVIEHETALVRVGNVREAIALESAKAERSRDYLGSVAQLKANRDVIARIAPDLLAGLQRHHDIFRGLLQMNLTVLATAHAVSEGIVRGVNSEVQRRNVPQTYTAAGVRAAPGPRHLTPLAVSRSL